MNQNGTAFKISEQPSIAVVWVPPFSIFASKPDSNISDRSSKVTHHSNTRTQHPLIIECMVYNY